jgi:hypothetical protein
MAMLIRTIFIILIFTGTLNSWSQSFLQPNFGLKSHETLVVNSIEISDRSTIVSLTVENKKEGGSFCADRNIYLIYPDGSREKLISSTGIPVCPDTYKFKYQGERLTFTLTFPRLKNNPEWIDLVEECSDNCFYFFGLTLDNVLNGRINETFRMAETGDPVKAMMTFVSILESVESKNHGIEGLLYVNIISLAKLSGNVGQASDWYKKLMISNAPRISEYVKHLNSQGIRY